MGFKIICEGAYALFTDPCAKTERTTYPVPTPSAMEGLLRSVFWKPAIRYVIDEIVVFNPIVTAGIRRNEVKDKISLSQMRRAMRGEPADPCVYTKESISQRASSVLKDVRYGVAFHFVLTGMTQEENADAKYAEIIARRLKKGQCFRAPCFGCREFPVSRLYPVDRFDRGEIAPENLGERDLGLMLYGLNYRDDTDKLRNDWNSAYFSDRADAVYYHPYMRDGVIDVAAYRGTRLC